MYSIVECGGFQFKVAEGDTIRVPLMNAAADSEVLLDKVILAAEGDSVSVGTPYVEGCSVKAKVVEHEKGPKVRVMKRKRRKDYRRRNGHRQGYTKLQIVSVAGK